MKVLLIKPPFNPNLITTTLYEPLELEYLGASVKEHDVEILDMRIDRNLIKKLSVFDPDVVGISAYTCDVNTAKKILNDIKKYRSSIKTTVGGIHATFMPEDFKENYVDAIFLGYADKSFKEYVDALESGEDLKKISNLGLVENGTIHFTEKKLTGMELDSIPEPNRDLTRNYRRKYHDSRHKSIALVMTSRGCPYRCTFCACWKLMEGRFSTRSIDSVIKELKNLPDNIKSVYFSDDNTFHNIKWARQLCDAIKEHRIKKNYLMYARPDSIVKNPDLFQSFKEAGLSYLTVGFESIHDKDLQEINKKTSVEMNNEAIRTLKRLNIHINAHFLVKPDFSKDDFNQLRQYVVDKKLFRPAYPVLTPLPGTELLAQTKDKMVIKEYDFFDFCHALLPTKLSRKSFYNELGEIYRKSYGFKRYFHSKITGLWKRLNREKNLYEYSTDGMSFLMLLLINLFGIRKFFQMKRAYKSEPL